jgi:hypothetical protein
MLRAEKNMNHVKFCALRAPLRSSAVAGFAVVLALALPAGVSSPVKAQGTLTPAQEQALAECLTGCKKGDADCQNSCTGKATSPAYLGASGACVRACADALGGPGQQDQGQAGDLAICVRACN